MSAAAAVLAELRQIDADVGLAGGRLYVDAPPGALSDELAARVRGAAPELVLLLAPLPDLLPEVSGWGPELRGAWEERAAILEYEGGLPRPAAERLAAADVRAAALGPAAELVGAAEVLLSAQLVDVRPSTRAAGGGRPVTHARCCGGCGCAALTDGGRGACSRCGWRRAG